MMTRRQFAAAASAAALSAFSPAPAEDECGFPRYRKDYGIRFEPLGAAPRKFRRLPKRPRIERPLLSEIQKDQRRLQALDAAYRRLATRGTSRSGLLNQAQLHRFFCGGMMENGVGSGCDVHGTWAFLAWHRGFLYFHERILESIAGRDFRLPVWDWETGQGVPQPWTRAPIADEFVCSSGRLASLPFLIDDCRLQAWLFTDKDFAKFAGRVNGPGSAVAGVHSDVHVSLFGAIAVLDTAAADPLFYAHHANVDRYWVHWTRQMGVSPPKEFLNQWFYYYDGHGNKVAVCVEQLMDLDALGYCYTPPKVKLTGINSTGFAGPVQEIHRAVLLPALSWIGGSGPAQAITSIQGLRAEFGRILSQAPGAIDGLLRGDALTPALPLTVLTRLVAVFSGQSLKVPVRIEGTASGLVPGKYYGVELNNGVDHVAIAGFGMFSHASMQSGPIVATGCFGEDALRMILTSTTPVQLKYGPTDTSGNITERRELTSPVWTVLHLVDGLRNLASGLLPL